MSERKAMARVFGKALLQGMVTGICVVALWLGMSGATAVQASEASEERLDAFLEVTGFDIALDSIRLGATNAPQILGLEAQDFGVQWTALADQVFEPNAIRRDAKALLAQALSDEMLGHAALFYASDLGARLVAVENAAHLAEDSAEERAQGAALVAEMEAEGAARLGYLKRMNHAIDPQDIGTQAAQDVQIRFLLAASDAGVINRIDEATLRSLMAEQAAEMSVEIEASALASAARIYQSFDDTELETYAKALEDPVMQQVYELMNGVQYALMADRYERLALRMAELSPGEEL